MAVTNKDFKIKHGLVVEGATGTINGADILTKSQADQTYIIGLIGGSATPDATPDTVVLRDENADFSAGTITADLVGDVTGTVSDISNHTTDSLSEGTGSLYFTDFRAQTAVSNALGTGLSYGDQGSGNVFHVDENVISTKTYADAAADAAYANAQDYAELKASDAQAAAIETASQDATTKANNAQSAAEDYADGLAVNYDAAGSATTAYNNAVTYADGLASNYDPAGSASTAQTNAQNYADTAIANLVDSAPATLDTLNELAAALQDNPDIIGDLQDIAAGKQDTLTAGSNIDITGATISVTGLDTDDVSEGTNLYFTNQRAIDAQFGLWDSEGAAAQALSDANDYTNTTVNGLDTDDIEEGVSNLYFTNQRALDATALAYDTAGTAMSLIDALDTDDIEEGVSNLYFSDVRAKTSAAALITGATKTNITITGDENGLTITAENGVADSTTDDLTEGEENLYFTDARAIDAVSGADIYPNAVIINNLTKQVANQVTVATAGIATGISWAKADYRSAEFVVKVAYGDHTEISKVLMTLDVNDNIAITEYGNVTTNGSASSISADISGTDARLRVTTVNNASTVTVLGTLIA